MCLAAMGKITKIKGDTATIDYDGVIRKANIAFIDASPGDYVLVHAGFAIQKVSKEEYEKNNRFTGDELGDG